MNKVQNGIHFKLKHLFNRNCIDLTSLIIVLMIAFTFNTSRNVTEIFFRILFGSIAYCCSNIYILTDERNYMYILILLGVCKTVSFKAMYCLILLVWLSFLPINCTDSLFLTCRVVLIFFNIPVNICIFCFRKTSLCQWILVQFLCPFTRCRYHSVCLDVDSREKYYHTLSTSIYHFGLYAF